MPVTPPPGYQLDVKPPAGYSLDSFASSVKPLSEVPAFIQSGVDAKRIQQVPAKPESDLDKQAIAYVHSDDPYKINVNKPGEYDKSVFSHELTHTFQLTRNDAIDGSAPVQHKDGKPVYDYGGLDGLKKAKSIADFSDEQQANIVSDYKGIQDHYLRKAATGKITADDRKKFYEARQAYHPLVKQLAEMPGKNEHLQPSTLDVVLNRNLPTINTKPEAPGLPPYDTPGLGVVPADPLLGGRSVGIRSKK